MINTFCDKILNQQSPSSREFSTWISFGQALFAINLPEVCLFGGFFGAASLVTLDPYEPYDESMYASDLAYWWNFFFELLKKASRLNPHNLK